MQSQTGPLGLAHLTPCRRQGAGHRPITSASGHCFWLRESRSVRNHPPPEFETSPSKVQKGGFARRLSHDTTERAVSGAWVNKMLLFNSTASFHCSTKPESQDRSLWEVTPPSPRRIKAELPLVSSWSHNMQIIPVTIIVISLVAYLSRGDSCGERTWALWGIDFYQAQFIQPHAPGLLKGQSSPA